MRNDVTMFNDTVGKLVQWYLKGELNRGSCYACVVGNLCGRYPDWSYLFMTDACTKKQQPVNFEPYQSKEYRESKLKEATEVCLSTGYTIKELAKIEHTFETAPYGNTKDNSMFNGLMAVVDTLAEIHKIDLSVKENAKALFVKI